MGTIVFIIVLSVLVVVHEWGHFVMAKRLGVRVERFAIGFGPKIFGRVIDGTEFALCLIPLGGYVKMAGEERKSCHGRSDEFYTLAPGKRAQVVMAGPIVNYCFAFLCFWLVFWVGYPTMSTKIGALMDGYPAQKSGLLPGDAILRIDNIMTQNWEDVQEYTSRSSGEPLAFEVLRDGQVTRVVVAPVEEEAKNIFGQKTRLRFIGIRPEEKLVLLKYRLWEAAGKAGKKIWGITVTTYRALYLMVTGTVAPKEVVTGPIGIFFIIKEAAGLGFSYVLYIMAVISASLAIFNLLPLPVLDGGHLALFGLEKIRRRALPEKTEEWIGNIGVGLIIFLALFVFYSDFVRYGIFDKILSFSKSLGF